MKPTEHSMLSESLIPNSIAYKKSNLEKAHEVLLIAKSIPRKIRRANPNECEFSREIQNRKIKESEKNEDRKDGLISAKEAKRMFSISEFTINNQRKSGALPFKKEKRNYYYDPEDIKKLDVRTYKKR